MTLLGIKDKQRTVSSSSMAATTSDAHYFDQQLENRWLCAWLSVFLRRSTQMFEGHLSLIKTNAVLLSERMPAPPGSCMFLVKHSVMLDGVAHSFCIKENQCPLSSTAPGLTAHRSKASAW